MNNNDNSTVNNNEIDKFTVLAEHWWDKEGALKTLHDINPTRLQFIQQNISLLNKRVLDVGCGGGILSEALAKLGAKVTGLDANSSAIEQAKLHAAGRNLSLNYVCSALEDYDEAAFDVIVCMELLEHVENPALLIQHCGRLLKPGGMIFLSTINRTLKAYTQVVLGAEYVLQIIPKQTHDFQKFIKPSELTNWLRQAGMRPIEVMGLSYNPITRQSTLDSCIKTNYLVSSVKDG